MDAIRRRVVVSGRVQGVWFRASTQRAAVDLGVNGWVHNLPSGQVEAVFEGDPAQVDEAIAWVRMGPPRAEVTDVDVFEESPEGLIGFDVR